MSAWLPRTKRSPSPIDRRDPGHAVPRAPIGSCGGEREHGAPPSPGSSPRRRRRQRRRRAAPMSSPPSPGPRTSVSWNRPKFSASAARSSARLDEVGDDRRAHDVLHRAEAGEQPAEDVEHPDRRVAGERDRGERGRGQHERRSGRAAAGGGGRCGRRARRRAATSRRAGRARPRRAGRSGTPSPSRRRSGRAARRARPACRGRRRPSRGRAGAGRATRAAA